MAQAKARSTTQESAEKRKPIAYVNLYVPMKVNGKIKNVKFGAVPLWEGDAVQAKYLSAVADMSEEEESDFFGKLLAGGKVSTVVVSTEEDDEKMEFVLG